MASGSSITQAVDKHILSAAFLIFSQKGLFLIQKGFQLFMWNYYNIITDIYVTPGYINDIYPYIERINIEIKKFNFNTEYIGADAGYFTNHISQKICEMELQTVMSYRHSPHVKGKFTNI